MNNQLKEIIANLSFPATYSNHIDDKTSLVTDLGFDSLQILRLLVEIENEFKIKIPYDKITPEIFESFQSFESFIKEC